MALRMLVDQGINNTQELHRITTYCLFIGIGISIASFLRSYNINSLCEKVVSDIRVKAYSSIIYKMPAYFEIRKTSDLISRLTNDTLLISNIIADVFSFAIRNFLMAVGGIALMFHVSPKLTSIMMAFLAVIVPIVIIFGKRVRVLARVTQEKTAFLTSDIEETFNAIKTIQALNIEERKIGGFKGLSNNLLGSALNRLKYRALFFSFVILVIITSIIMILWVGINDIMDGSLTAGELISFLYFAAQTSVSIGGISDIFSEIQRAFAAMERVFELISKGDKINNKGELVAIKGYDISFNDIDYSYPTRPQAKIFKNFNLEIKQGEFIGIVGKSGSGKSTLFQLLLRFFDIVNGEITIGGHNIQNMSLHQLRDNFAIVPQEPYIFSATARENILMANPEANEYDLIEAAKFAGIFDYINSLPEKFNSFLGEKGVRLSGGQKQRIAIARAILKRPQILLLDEATSALDSTNEVKVLEALKGIMKGKTIISIAHRIDTIKDADRIYVIDEGAIIGAGTHEELLESSDLYRQLNYKELTPEEA
jgi:ATP-binding cassette subfamily B protein